MQLNPDVCNFIMDITVQTHKLLQLCASFQVPTVLPVWCQVILKRQVETDNKISIWSIVGLSGELKGSNVIFFHIMKKLQCTLHQRTTVHFASSYLWDMNATHKKGITTFLFASLAKVCHLKPYKSRDKKKKEQQLSCCSRSSTFGFCFFLFLYEVIQADRATWSFNASPHPPWQKLHPKPPPFLCSDSWWRWEQQDGQKYMNLMYHLPLNEAQVLLTRCTQFSALLQGENGGHCSEVQQPRSYKQLVGWEGQSSLLRVISGVLIAGRTWGLGGRGGWRGWGGGRRGGKVHPW